MIEIKSFCSLLISIALINCYPIYSQQIEKFEVLNMDKSGYTMKEMESCVERTAWNTIFIELLGNGLIASLNYERFLTEKIPLRVGILPAVFAGFASMTITISILEGKNNHALEAGIGATGFIQGSHYGGGSNIILTSIIGYRYQPRNGGFMFKAALTPLIELTDGRGNLWFGISLGHCF